MKINDIVIVASLGEIKTYKALPKTLEAEAGLKENEIKLDLINDINIIEAHKKLQDLITDIRGNFKPSFLKNAISGEKHNLEQEIYKETVKIVAEDIDKIIEENNPKRVFLAIPKIIKNDVLNYIKNKDKIFKIVEKDLIKTDKNSLLNFF